MRRRLRILVGLMAWGGGLVGIGWLANNQADKALGQRVAPQLWQYASGSRSSVPLEMSDQLDLRGGDPIFLSHEDGRLVQIGEIGTPPARRLPRPCSIPRLPLRHPPTNWPGTPRPIRWPGSSRP